ncbi:unnamed protein product [Meloidogyne enterolobii]|uniref:Uncharacterized protein n=1 Tax=Meloidogyne enterolobii TaxID=390850 RepID=A0ACB1APU0_MELEN
MVLLEEELDKLEERCKVATEKMEEATVNCDESERERKAMLQRATVDDDRCAELEARLREAQSILHEAEARADEVLMFIFEACCVLL